MWKININDQTYDYSVINPKIKDRTIDRLKEIDNLWLEEVWIWEFWIPWKMSWLYIEKLWSYDNKSWNNYIQWIKNDILNK